MANPKRKNPQSTAISYYESSGDTYPDVSAANPLPIAIISGAGSGGTAMTDDAAFTPGTTSVTPVAGTYRVTRDSVNDGDGGALAMTATRALLTAIETPNGDSAMDDTNDALRVNIVAGSSSGTEYTEDAAAAANPAGPAVILVRQDSPTALTTTDGDNVAQRGTNYGAAYAQIVTSAGAFVDTFGGGTQYTQGDTDASITGTAMMMEGAADTLLPVQGTVADGLLVNLGGNNDVVVSGTAANGAAISGNPVLLGGEDPSGNVATLQTAADGDLIVHQHSASTVLADAVSNTMQIPINQTDAGFLATPTAGYMYNGTTWDRMRGSATDGLTVNLGANNDVTVASLPLPSGASTAANQSTIIGHVDGIEGLLTTIDADTSTLAAVDYATGADVASLAVVGGGAEATAMRVTIANDSTGVVSVDDNGGSITVDGTITEANSAAIAASLSVLDDWDETNRAAVNIIAGQVGVAGGSGVDGATVQRVTLATDVALPAGTNAIGKLAANSGVDIGDVDVASIAAGTNIIGRVGHDITGIGHGVTTVTTAGTDVALAGSTACKSVIITAQTDNTNIIAVGTSGVDATIATGTGVPLSPGDSICIEIDNLADIFIDSLVNGEGVRYMYFT